MPSTDIVMAAAGAVATSQTYVEDVFSSYIYTGNGATQSINTGVSMVGAAANTVFQTPTGIGSSTIALGYISRPAVNSSGLYVSVGYANSTGYPVYVTSTDGVNWSAPAVMNGSSTIAYMQSIAVNSSGRFVAVGYSSTQIPLVATSTDGVTWTTPTAINGTTVSTYMFSIAVNNSGLFVAVGFNSSTYPTYTTSTDGLTWTTPAVLIASGYALQGIAVNSSGLFVAVGYETTGYASVYTTTTNGTSWSGFTTFGGGTAYVPTSICVSSAGKFVTVGYWNGVWYTSYSTNGTTWSAITASGGSSTKTSVAVNSAGRFMAIGSSGTGSYYSYSDDGISWSADLFVPYFGATGIVANSSGLFVAIGIYNSTRLGATTKTNSSAITGSGGLVWVKQRGSSETHVLVDTTSPSNYLQSSTTSAYAANSFLNLTSSGYYLTGTGLNTSAAYYGSWSFKKSAKFFDIVSYTGTGVARTIAHNLGATPGMIIVKCTSTTGNWGVYSVGQTSAGYVTFLNTTGAEASSPTTWNSTAPTASVFSVGTSNTTNTNGASYVAYIFGNDATTSGMIRCGSFTTDASGGATVTLGWEPQYIMVKAVSGAGDWVMSDTMRGFSANPQATRYLLANTTGAEAEYPATYFEPTATGFNAGTGGSLGSSVTYIYMAIRKGPMQTPTDPGAVFIPQKSYRATGGANISSFPIDLQWGNYSGGSYTSTRLTGVNTAPANISHRSLLTSSNAADATNAGIYYSYGWGNTGYLTPSLYNNVSTAYWNFRRAPGFMDIVSYNGNGGASQAITHNLGVAPELIIWKSRNSASYGWYAYAAPLGTGYYMVVNSTAAKSGFNITGGVTPTTTTFNTAAGGDGTNNGTGIIYVAYLFASCPGVSKVGSYTGTGSTQTINCGFAGGARFVLIKRTDAVGDWLCWDTSSGMQSGYDYKNYFSLAGAAVNVNSVYTITNGFQVVGTDTSINASGGSYLYLAVA